MTTARPVRISAIPLQRIALNRPRARWADFYDWKRVERGGEATPSAAHQTCLQVCSAILTGRLRAGGKLPSWRDLAARVVVVSVHGFV